MNLRLSAYGIRTLTLQPFFIASHWRNAVRSAGFFLTSVFSLTLEISAAPLSIFLMSKPRTANGTRPTGQSTENLPPTPAPTP